MEFNSDVEFQNPLNFPKYKEKVDSYKEKQKSQKLLSQVMEE